MPGLIEEIQRDALNPMISVSTLLRKVKVAATKLRLGKVEAWVESELNGYKGEIPSYREIYGRPEYWNPYHGWQPLQSNDRKLNELLSRSEVRQSISSLEEIVRRSEDGVLRMMYNADMVASLNKMLDIPLGNVGIRVSVGQGHDIVEAVRNQVLDWALGLEKVGVTGEGYTFRTEEVAMAREQAMTFNIGHIGSFAGNLGSGNTAGSITLNVANWSELQKFADQVEKAAKTLGSEGADTAKLAGAITQLKTEIAKTEPDRGIVRALLTDVRNAVSGAAGSLLASGIIAQVVGFLGS